MTNDTAVIRPPRKVGRDPMLPFRAPAPVKAAVEAAAAEAGLSNSEWLRRCVAAAVADRLDPAESNAA